MKYVLDTNIVSAWMQGAEPLLARLVTCSPASLGMPGPVLGELEYGLQRLPRSHRRTALAHKLSAICQMVTPVEWTQAVSRHFGSIKAALESRGHRLEDFDVANAAHARAHNATLVTRNLKQLGRVPELDLEDWLQSH